MTTTDSASDSALWEGVLNGELTAFEQVVQRHQNAVSGVAYGIVGDFALGQDVAQETFWQAYRNRQQLLDPARLAGWLCGIARNIAYQSLRSRRVRHESIEAIGVEDANPQADPSLALITTEESQLVWGALEEIPEAYREVLILYYRQGESMQQVADIMDLSVDAVKQRLSRGRQMLKSQLAMTVEGVLMRSRPSHVFTARVMGGVAALAASFKILGGTASASAMSGATLAAGGASIAAVGGKALTMGSVAGIAGGSVGALGGLGGAYLGTWLPAQMAPTRTERELMTRFGKTALIVSLVYTLVTLFSSFLLFVPRGWILYTLVVGVSTVSFVVWCIVMSVRLQREVQEIRAAILPEDDPNPTAMRAMIERRLGKRWKGRCYRSSRTFLGVPLIDIQFSDLTTMPELHSPARSAWGWIAFGDRATGILFAMGGLARGAIAIGGVAIGGVAIGGFGVGLLSLAGGAIGIFAVGGLAVGYDAIGGAAIAWHAATGGGAMAYHLAAGGGALAYEYAVGGGAYAREANTELAKEFAAKESFLSWLGPLSRYQFMITFGSVVLPFLAMACLIPIAYERDRETESLSSGSRGT